MSASRSDHVSWWRPAVSLGAAVQTRRMRSRLRRTHDAAREQAETLHWLLARMATTHFGVSEGIESRMSWNHFARRVTPRPYEDIAPWIDRVKRGEADVIWPGRCDYFAVSSGTTAGRTKYLPVTPAMLDHFRRAGLDQLFYHAARMGRSTVFRGRHLFLGGSTTLTPLPENPRARAGDLSGITAVNLPAWAERHLYEPGREIAQMSDWNAKLRAMVERTRHRDIRLLGGIPSWLLILGETMQEVTGKGTLREVWPNLECLVHGGVPIGPFAEDLKRLLGPGVSFHEVYPASEGFIAAQDASPEAGLRLITNAGIFYEFVPLERFNEGSPSDWAAHAVPLEGVRCGTDYVLLMTTPAGLCRYVIGDVVRFLSTHPPRLVYAGRTRLQLSAFGEHVLEKELTDAVAAVSAELGLSCVNFHVAPRFVNPSAGETRGRHEWWLELRAVDAGPLNPDRLALALDARLQRSNDDYEAKRLGGGLDAPWVHVVAPGTFERWMRAEGKWGGQSKMPRCRSDRQIADALSALSAP